MKTAPMLAEYMRDFGPSPDIASHRNTSPESAENANTGEAIQILRRQPETEARATQIHMTLLYLPPYSELRHRKQENENDCTDRSGLDAKFQLSQHIGCDEQGRPFVPIGTRFGDGSPMPLVLAMSAIPP